MSVLPRSAIIISTLCWICTAHGTSNPDKVQQCSEIYRQAKTDEGTTVRPRIILCLALCAKNRNFSNKVPVPVCASVAELHCEYNVCPAGYWLDVDTQECLSIHECITRPRDEPRAEGTLNNAQHRFFLSL